MEMQTARILVIDDDYDVLKSAHLLLKRFYSEVHIEQIPENISRRISKENYDVVLLDMNFQKGRRDGLEGFFWLRKILELDPQMVVIMITAYGDLDQAILTIRAGANDFILKPWKNQKLLATIHSAIQLRDSKREAEQLRITHQRLNEDLNLQAGEFICESDEMKQCMAIADRVATTDASVLLLGENGTGKEVIARTLHLKSERRLGAFVPVDLGALSESLFESELFGHAEGAFTDAKSEKPGRLELANGGTLFLDEIGNLSMSLQMKLLSVLQNRISYRVGSVKEIPVDFRLICATNSRLYEMVQSLSFREDLMYRINTIEIHVPPLRKRTKDIPLLLSHYLDLFKNKYNKPGLQISKKALGQLCRLEWPGNVRELKHTMERLVILSDKKSIETEDLMPGSGASTAAKDNKDVTLLDDMEKQHIIKIIERNRGNVTRAAIDLGISRTSLHRRLRKYDI